MSDDEIMMLDQQIKDEADTDTEMDAALADPDMGTNNIDGTSGPPNDSEPPSDG
jgi:hypothetical protein